MEEACHAARDGRMQFFDCVDNSKVASLTKLSDGDGRSLLHNAVSGKNVTLFKTVLGYGADCNTADDEVSCARGNPVSPTSYFTG